MNPTPAHAPSTPAAPPGPPLRALPGGQQAVPDRAESYRRLADVFHHLLSEQSLDALLERVADTLADLVPYDALHVYRADEPARELSPVFARTEWAEQVMSNRPQWGRGITGWAVANLQPVLTNSAHLDPRVVLVPGTPLEPEALICVPLVARGVLKGTLNIYREGEDAFFSDEDFELAKRLAAAAALAFDNAEIRAQLEHEAQTDPLTGLYNHRAFHERLRAELARAGRSGEPVAVLMTDIDHFKRVNDVYGHGCGDRVLVTLAHLARATAREFDVVCRLGGEEFGLVLPGCSRADAVVIGERLRDRMRATEFEVGTITASVGIACAPEHGMNPRELVTCAEAAMMTAKARGGDQVEYFDAELVERPGPSSRERDARSIAHLKMLQSLAGRLNRLNDLREIGAAITDELRALIDYHNCRVYIREGQDLVPIAFRGDGCPDCERGLASLACRVGQGITGTCAATGRSVLVGNALDCEYAVRVPGTDDIDESILAVPLLFGSRVIGVLALSKLGVGQLDEHDVRLLEVLAGHASVAVENARLYEAAREEARNANELLQVAEALLAFSRELAEARGLDDVTRRVADLARSTLAAPRASVWLQDAPGGELRAHAASGYAASQRERVLALRFPAHALSRLGAGDAPFSVGADEVAAVAGSDVPSASARYAIAPLRLGASRAGCIVTVAPDHSGGALSSRTLELLAGMAHQASIAIANAFHFQTLERTFLSTVEALANAAEANDESTSSHARDITDLALHVATELELDDHRTRTLELAALFHDIGKIGIPNAILRKPGGLTPDERAVVEQHSALGERILAPIEQLREVSHVVRHCHERYDGLGYPDGAGGKQIPLEARVIFVCDAYHAMTTDRPYRKALPHDEAKRRLVEGAGTQFDPEIVKAFLRSLESRRAGRA